MGAAHAVQVRDRSSVSATRSPLWPSKYEWDAADDWQKTVYFRDKYIQE
jgi:hypothetical protein